MLKMIKSSVITAGLLFASTSVFALPPTTIEKVYYATSDKEEVVGYFYQGCVITSNVQWGTRTYHYENVGFRHDCTNLGDYQRDYDGFCIVEGISHQLRNSGEVSVIDFRNIKDSC